MNFLIQIVVGLILSIASTLLQQAFAPQQQEQQRRTGTRGSAQIGGKVPQYFLIGTVGDAGKLEYRNSWGNDGEVPNAYVTDVYSFGDIPITAMTKVFIGGVLEPISSTGLVTQGYPATGDKAGNFWARFFDGTQTTANSFLTGKFGSDADRPWLTDMIGRGIPYITTTALWSETLWTGFPQIIAELQGIKLYDPRLDTTAGGSGSQRWADPSTWAFSDNNMVIIYNIERGIYYDGAHVWGGKKTEAEMPYAAWAAAMDACDESVTLDAGGSEKRFRAGRRIALNERPGDVIKEFLIGCNGRIVHAADGTVWPLVGVPDEADGAFTDASVLATNALGTIPFPNLDSIINGATATYREPTQAWEDKETAPYLRSDLEAEDDGRQQVEGLDLGTTFSGTQAQRIIKAVIEEGRRFRTHVVALPPEFAQFRPLQVLAWTSDRFDYDAKLFLITARTVEPFGNVIFGLQEIDPADHDWNPATDEQPLSFAPVVTNRPAPQEVSGFSVAPAIALDTEGSPRRPAIDVFWSAASVTVDVRAVRITIRLAADEVVVWEGEAPRPELGEARITQALLPDEDYEVQIQYVPESGRVTVESSWLSVTTPNVKLGADDIDITFAEIAGAIVAKINALAIEARDLRDRVEQQGTLQSEQDLVNFNDQQILVRKIESSTGNVKAGYLEAIEVATGPESAIAQGLETLYVAMGGSTSEVNVQWGASAGPDGYDAQYSVLLAVNDGMYRAASFWGLVPTDPDEPTRWVFDADQIVFTSDGGATVNALFEDGTTIIRNARIQNLTADNIAAGAITSDEIAAGAITADKITALKLDAAEILQGGTILEDVIADNAVTKIYVATASGGLVASSGTATFCTLTPSPAITTGTMFIQGSGLVTFSVGSSGSQQAFVVSLRKNGTVVSSSAAVQPVANAGFQFTVPVFYLDPSPAGAIYTITVESVFVVSGECSISALQINAINNKR